MTVQPLGNSTFLINPMVFVAITWFSISLASLLIQFPTAFHQLSLSPRIDKVYIVCILLCLFYMWKTCGNLKNDCQQHSVLLGCGNCFTISCRTTYFIMNFLWCHFILFSLENLGYLLIFFFNKIHGFGCGSKLGGVEVFNFGGNVGSNASVCITGYYTSSYVLGSGVCGLVISGGKIFILTLW